MALVMASAVTDGHNPAFDFDINFLKTTLSDSTLRNQDLRYEYERSNT
jgi:hypothetical protein